MSSANTTCKFFLQGNCRYGGRCRFYHPRREQQGGVSLRHHAPPSYDNSSLNGRNRFSLFSDWNNGNDDGGGSNGGRGRGDHFQNRDQYGGQQDRYHYISPNYRSSHHRDQGEEWRGGGRRGGWEGGGRGGRGGGRGKGEGWDGGGGWRGRGRDKRGDIRRDNHRGSYSSSSSATDAHQDYGSGGNGGRQRGDQFQNQDQYGGKQDHTSPNYSSSHHSPNYISSHHRDQGEGWSSATGSHQDLVKDMKKWKTSSMWPLSCYGNSYQVPYLPGLVDVSPEEMRFEAYMAKSSGTSAEYLKNVAELLSQQTSLISKYADLTLEDMKQLENLSPVSSGNGSSGLFGSLTKSGLFHSATATSALTNTSLNRSLFGEPQLSLSQTENKQTGTTLFTPSSIPQMNTLPPKNLFTSLASAVVSSSPSSSQEASLLSAATTGTNPDDTSELTKEVLMAFKVDVFIFKQIPESLPPPHLC